MKVKNNPDFTPNDGDEAVDNTAAAAATAEAEAITAGLDDEQPAGDEPAVEADEDVTADEVVADAPAPVAPAKIKIGDKEYDPAELNDIVVKGSKIKEWETRNPGFNVDTFMPDYTKKSQRLAALEQRLEPPAADPKELEELGLEPGQIQAFEKVAKHLGFVKNADLVNRSVDAQKEVFLQNHPEYAPGVAGADDKWNKLIGELNLYNWRSMPHRVEEFLERAHSQVSTAWKESARGTAAAKQVALRAAAAAAAASTGGGGGAPAPHVTVNANAGLAEQYRAMGWSEDDIKEVLST